MDHRKQKKNWPKISPGEEAAIHHENPNREGCYHRLRTRMRSFPESRREMAGLSENYL